MFVNSKKIAKIIEELAPKYFAESWDNVGFQVGNINSEVDKVMVALEVTDAVIDEAIEKNVDLLLVHHPLIFKGLKRITTDDPIANMVMRMLKNGINLYVAHTNLDIAIGGTNDYICDLLELKDVAYLSQTHETTYYKLETFIPTDHTDNVREKMAASGAGRIDNYSDCTFKVSGTGTFKPLEGSTPFIGEKGALASVEEDKLEAIVEATVLDEVVNSMINAHPYEVPAYNVVKLDNKIESFGLGRYGVLEAPMELESFVELVKEKLGMDQIRYVASKQGFVRRIGICTGAGSDLMTLAQKKGCDVYITGDLKYHEAQLAKQLNLNVIDGGHYETENIYAAYMAEKLSEIFGHKGYDVAVIPSETNINPFSIK